MAVEPVLQLEDVVAGYGQTTILHGVTFDVARGAISTIIGPNGAGKSTVLKVLFGFLKTRRGRVMFDGEDITGWQPRELLARGICYVPQGRNIFGELSVWHNLEIGCVSAPKGFDVAGTVEAMLQRFPTLQRKAKHQASTLSGGEQKLLEIARGLLLQPKLILIDEPSVGLSPLMVKQLMTILQDLRAQGVTILMVEQNARTALEISDFGIVLEGGKTRLRDTAAAILVDPRVAQLFLGGQLVEAGGAAG